MVQNSKLLREAYATIETFLVQRSINFVTAYAGFFVFARLCPSDDPAMEQNFQSALKRRNVCLASGTSYRFKQRGWYRVVFALPPEELKKGLARIEKSIAAVEAEA